jgi:hypothetical protein
VQLDLGAELIADGEPNPEELAQFEHTVATLPFGRDRAQLQLVTRATVERLRTSNDDGKRAFMKELADAIPGALREKVVLDMASIMAADQVATGAERGTAGAFILSFGLDPQAVKEAVTGKAARPAPPSSAS